MFESQTGIFEYANISVEFQSGFLVPLEAGEKIDSIKNTSFVSLICKIYISHSIPDII